MVSQSFSLLYAKKGESLKALNLDGEKTDDMKVITGIAFSDSGKLIATYTYGTVCVIDPESGHVEQNVRRVRQSSRLPIQKIRCCCSQTRG